MRGWVGLLFCAFALSGCSGGDGGGGDDAPETPLVDPNVPMVPEEPEIQYTNRIWFGEAPAMQATAPALADPARTAMASNQFGGGGGGMGPGPESVWEYDFQGNGTLTGGVLHVWVEVVEQSINPPNPFDTFRGGPCTWQADVMFLGEGEDPLFEQEFCVQDSTAVFNPGEVELEFELDFSANLAQGNSMVVELSRSPYSASPDSAMYVLSGTQQYDTWIEFNGLFEPLPAEATA
jgi:hypothetical protein